MLRRFQLNRIIDVTGVSGTGIVAEGVQFSDGECCLHWKTHTISTTVYKSIDDIENTSGHQGSTVIDWID